LDHMTTQPDPTAASAVGDNRATHAPWLPLIVIVLAQLQMAVNVSALPVSLGTEAGPADRDDRSSPDLDGRGV
jgi:hypothetical protein